MPEAPPFCSRVRLSTVADYEQSWTWYADGTPVDLTGCHARFDLRVTPTDAAPLLAVSDVSSASGMIVLGTTSGGNAGIVELAISHTALASLTATVAHGELLVTMATGQVVEFAELLCLIDAGSTY